MNDDMQGTTTVDERTETAETAAPLATETPAPRRRGRPPGSGKRQATASVDSAPVAAAPLQAQLPEPPVASAPGADGAPTAPPHVVSDREMFGDAGLMTTTEPPEMPEPPASLAPAREVPARPQPYGRPPREERPQRPQAGQPYSRPPRD